MAHRLACEHSERFAGIVSMAGAGPATAEQCAAQHPVAVLEIHGERDPIVPFEGGHLFGRAELPVSPSVRSGARTWARIDGCSGELEPRGNIDWLEALPGAETRVFRFSACSARPVELWEVLGGEHAMPIGRGALDRVWAFLSGTPPAAR
jgi:polyhydroxybutyrate depolymerase